MKEILFFFHKELAIKRDRSFRRIDDEKNFLSTKQIEIEKLEKEIEKKQQEKMYYEKIISHYQPHLNLLTQVNEKKNYSRTIRTLQNHSSYLSVISVGLKHEDLFKNKTDLRQFCLFS